MRICQYHWSRLRKAMDDRGLGGFGAKNEQEARAVISNELEGRDAENDFNPLMTATWMIMNRALELGGLATLGTDEKGNEHCPVCLAMKQSRIGGEDGFRDMGHVESHWIDGPADTMLKEAKEKGLV